MDGTDLSRVKKKELLATVDLLIKADASALEIIEKRQAGLEELLATGQELAITLGGKIEARERDSGDDASSEIVHALEEYCETLYQLSWQGGDAQKGRKLVKLMNRQLLSARQGIQYRLPDDKKEIVFLPYKASMWDSLESFWLEARKGEDCETYVVPIPYYDKNPDGSIRLWHYEGNEYPDYVPITPWEQYDIEARKPDEAYIHNPYDEFNHVTSVHPKFYSSELKKHVGRLIYAPYFSAGDDVAEHFIKVPGVVNADTVIVQSEKIREKYASVFVDFVGEGQKEHEKKTGRVNREFWAGLKKTAEKKFIVKPSPKIDRVERTKREDVTIPDEWQKIINGSDGRKKPVIFYNTTIDALLKNSGSYMQKVQSVLRTFKENQDVALWWRPHPLLQSTLDSMLPQLSPVYRAIVEQYRREGWGIFDDTPDVTRAVVATDAYYGDWSSVVHMYKATGKPIMIQNVSLP